MLYVVVLTSEFSKELSYWATLSCGSCLLCCGKSLLHLSHCFLVCGWSSLQMGSTTEQYFLEVLLSLGMKSHSVWKLFRGIRCSCDIVYNYQCNGIPTLYCVQENVRVTILDLVKSTVHNHHYLPNKSYTWSDSEGRFAWASQWLRNLSRFLNRPPSLLQWK